MTRKKIGALRDQSEYQAWRGARSRCHDSTNRDYPKWGGRGITMCEKWRNSYKEFLNSMGRRPGKGYSLDRKDNNGNYEPGNCRWTTRSEQASNTRHSIAYTLSGYRTELEC